MTERPIAFVMKSSSFRRSAPWLAPASLALVAGALPAGAQITLPPLEFEETDRAGYFVRFAGRALFNVRASVELQPGTPQTPGNYDNGFVLPDAGGTASGLTWNWGYEDAAQVQGDSLNFERYSNLPRAGVFADEKDDPALGGEVLFGAEFGRFDVRTREWSWGVEIGYGYNPFKVSNTSTASGTVDYLAASHALNGIVPPVAPYSGTFDGPGPVIDLNPSAPLQRSSAATTDFEGTLKSDLHAFKVGLWLDAPIAENWSVALSLGYSSILADSELRVYETFNISNPGIPAVEATDATVSDSGWRNGFYAQLRLNWQFSHQFGAFLGGDIQYNNRYEFTGAGRKVTLDFTGTYGAVAGLTFDW